MNSSFKPLPPETVQNPASPVDTQTRSRRRRAALRSLCNLPFLLPPLGVRAGLRMNSQPMPSKGKVVPTVNRLIWRVGSCRKNVYLNYWRLPDRFLSNYGLPEKTKKAFS